MRVDMGDEAEDEAFAGEWVQLVAEHTPRLETPHGVQLTLEDPKTKPADAQEEDGQHVVITVPPRIGSRVTGT